MIFFALLASILICSVSASPLMVVADSSDSSSEDSSQSYEWIDSFDGYISFNNRTTYVQTAQVQTVTDNSLSTTYNSFFYPVGAYYSSVDGLRSVVFGIEPYSEGDLYNIMMIPFNTNEGWFPFIFVRGDSDDFDYQYFYGYNPVVYNDPYSASIYPDNRALDSWFGVECQAGSMANPTFRYWSYISKICNDVASLLVRFARPYQQDAYSNGYQDGMNANTYYAEQLAYANGYDSGYSNGNRDGYNTGYNAGRSAVSDAGLGIMTLFGSIANIPITVINGLGDLVVFDVPIISILSTFLIIGLFCFVIRKVI